MSTKELKRLEIIQKVDDKRLTQKEAGIQLTLTDRQIRNLLSGYRAHGAKGLISKKRGGPSNRAHSQAYKAKVMSLVGEHYADFGPTFASEKLLERDKVVINHETLRQWMIEATLWKSKKVKRKTVHERRKRRSCLGELVQIDGSPHDWFEGRGERCCLIVFIDDATGNIMYARFCKAETTFAYFHVVKEYIERYGMPKSFYSDKHGIFRVNIKNAMNRDTRTQFERAMQNLGIELINAHSPQAKGRVERANQTLQDRLVKEMRLRNISNMAAGNDYLPDFIVDFNERFAVPPSNATDLHQKEYDDDKVQIELMLQNDRKLSKTLTFQYGSQLYQINVPGEGYTLRQAYVTVCEAESGEIAVLYKGRRLDYTVFDKQMQYSQVVSDKELETKAKPKLKAPYKPPANAPWRRFVINPNKASRYKPLAMTE